MRRMPRPSLIVFLLVLRFLLCGAYGSRLGILCVKGTSDTLQKTSLEHNYNYNENDAAKKYGNGNIDGRETQEIEVVGEDEDGCALSEGTLLKRSRMSRVAQESHHDYHHHHWFPWIYEDYRGPKRHIPRHH